MTPSHRGMPCCTDCSLTEKTLSAAVSLIKPSADRRDECRADVRETLMLMHKRKVDRRSHRLMRGKEGRERLKQLRRGLKLVQILMRKPLPVALRDDETDKFFVSCGRLITLCDWLLRAPTDKPRPDSSDKMDAAHYALALLIKYQQPAKTTKKGDGNWNKLAATLYGQPRENLHYHCTEIRANPEIWQKSDPFKLVEARTIT
jgi:hypothetical protein